MNHLCTSGGTLSSHVGPAQCTSPTQSTIDQWGYTFYTVREDAKPSDICVRTRIVGFVNVWLDCDPVMEPHRPHAFFVSWFVRA